MPVDQERIHSLFRKLGREASKLSSKPQPKNIHQFRTSTRRVEAWVEQFVPEPDRNLRKLLKQIGRLRKRAGRVRDMHVLIEHLRNLRVSEEPGRKAEVMRALADLRRRREQKLIEAADENTVRELRKRLKRAEASVLLASKRDPAAVALQKFNALARNHESLSEEVLHQYRIEGKRIRYIAELGGNGPEAQHIVKELKRMQDAVGEWHDWVTLSQTVQELWSDGRPSALLSALNNISHAKFRDAIQVVTETRTALLQKLQVSSKLPATAAGRKPASSGPIATSAVA